MHENAKRGISRYELTLLYSYIASKEEWLIINSFNILIKNRGEQLVSSGPFLRTKNSLLQHPTIQYDPLIKNVLILFQPREYV